MYILKQTQWCLLGSLTDVEMKFHMSLVFFSFFFFPVVEHGSILAGRLHMVGPECETCYQESPDSLQLLAFCAAHLDHTVSSSHRLVGLVVKASASRAGGPGFESR